MVIMKTLLCIILFSAVFLSGCTRVLIREPFGQALKEDDLGSVPAVYVDGSGNQFQVQKTESLDEFQVIDLTGDPEFTDYGPTIPDVIVDIAHRE